MPRPRLLDLFCGAGGAAMGYHRAGFDVFGVDIRPQPNYPFDFHQADAMRWTLDGFDAIHASPPCQAYSAISPGHGYPDLYEAIRARLVATGVPWVIENVIGAPYRSGFVLCGSMFDMRVRRHRNFETSFAVLAPACEHRRQGTPLGVYGDGGPGKSTRPSGGGGTKADRRQFGELMGMAWATPKEITQAIPPAYTEWLGRWLLDQLGHVNGVDQRRLPVGVSVGGETHRLVLGGGVNDDFGVLVAEDGDSVLAHAWDADRPAPRVNPHPLDIDGSDG